MTEYDLFPAIRFTYQGDVERAMQCVPHARALMQQLTRRMEAMGREVGVWNVTTPDGIEMVLQRFGDQVAAAIYAPAVDEGAAMPAPAEAVEAGPLADGPAEPAQRFKRDFREELVPVGGGGDLWIGARVVGGEWPTEHRRTHYEYVYDSRNDAGNVVTVDTGVDDTIYPGIKLVLFPPEWQDGGEFTPHESAELDDTLIELDAGYDISSVGPNLNYIPAENKGVPFIRGYGYFTVAEMLINDGRSWAGLPPGWSPSGSIIDVNSMVWDLVNFDLGPFKATEITNEPQTIDTEDRTLTIKYKMSDFGAFSAEPLIYNPNDDKPSVQTFISVSKDNIPKTFDEFYSPSDDVIHDKLYADLTNTSYVHNIIPRHSISSPANISKGGPYLVVSSLNNIVGYVLPYDPPEWSVAYASVAPEPILSNGSYVFPGNWYEDPYETKQFAEAVVEERNISDCQVKVDYLSDLQPVETIKPGVYELRMSLGWQEWVDEPNRFATVEVIIQMSGQTKTYSVDAPIGEYMASYDQNWRGNGRTSPFDPRPDYGEIWYPGYWLIDTETGSIIHETQDLTRPWFNA